VVSLIEEDSGGYRLEVELHALLPGVGPEDARKIMEQAHVTCPYSKALRGDTAVTLVVD
jgi:organic hydroperoxide reductase OsmC/OhrA